MRMRSIEVRIMMLTRKRMSSSRGRFLLSSFLLPVIDVLSLKGSIDNFSVCKSPTTSISSTQSRHTAFSKGEDNLVLVKLVGRN